jgi:hypothetical protein
MTPYPEGQEPSSKQGTEGAWTVEVKGRRGRSCYSPVLCAPPTVRSMEGTA